VCVCVCTCTRTCVPLCSCKQACAVCLVVLLERSLAQAVLSRIKVDGCPLYTYHHFPSKLHAGSLHLRRHTWLCALLTSCLCCPMPPAAAPCAPHAPRPSRTPAVYTLCTRIYRPRHLLVLMALAGAHGTCWCSCIYRPRHLLVLINPFSGAKRSRLVWEQKARPVFEKAHIKYTLVETLHPVRLGYALQRTCGAGNAWHASSLCVCTRACTRVRCLHCVPVAP